MTFENASLRQSAGAAPAEKEKKSLLVPTTPQERRNLEFTLSGDENDVIMDLQLANASARIVVMNLTCVRSGEWLNSETINVYLQMVEVASKLSGENVTSFNSFFVSKLEKDVCFVVVGYLFHTSHLTPYTSFTIQGHKGVTTWTRKLEEEGKTLFDLDRCDNEYITIIMNGANQLEFRDV